MSLKQAGDAFMTGLLRAFAFAVCVSLSGNAAALFCYLITVVMTVGS